MNTFDDRKKSFEKKFVRDEELELALRHDGVRQVEARVLPRDRLVQLEPVEEVVVRPVDGLALLELESAERVRDVLERVDDAVRVVVGRIDAPARAGARVRMEHHAVRRGVPQRRVVGVEVALHPQERFALGVPPLLHPHKVSTVLLRRQLQDIREVNLVLVGMRPEGR